MRLCQSARQPCDCVSGFGDYPDRSTLRSHLYGNLEICQAYAGLSTRLVVDFYVDETASSIERKRVYRFEILQSEEWKTARSNLLVLFDATCAICGKRDVSNDIHHVIYPKDILQTTTRHAVCLCRRCHDRVHERQKDIPSGTSKNERWRLYKESANAIRIELNVPFRPKRPKKQINAYDGFGVHDCPLDVILNEFERNGIDRTVASNALCSLLIQGKIRMHPNGNVQFNKQAIEWIRIKSKNLIKKAYEDQVRTSTQAHQQTATIHVFASPQPEQVTSS